MVTTRRLWALWLKPPYGAMQAFERVLAGVAERRVAEIVREGQRLGQVLVEMQFARDRAGDLRHLDAVGQPGAVDSRPRD